MKISKWIHPKTGVLRVYFSGLVGNGGASQSGAKVWAEQDGADGWTVKVFADWLMDKRQIRDAAYDAAEALAGRGCTWQDLLAAASSM